MRRELHAVADALHRSGEWLDTYGYALLGDRVAENQPAGRQRADGIPSGAVRRVLTTVRPTALGREQVLIARDHSSSAPSAEEASSRGSRLWRGGRRRRHAALGREPASGCAAIEVAVTRATSSSSSALATAVQPARTEPPHPPCHRQSYALGCEHHRGQPGSRSRCARRQGRRLLHHQRHERRGVQVGDHSATLLVDQVTHRARGTDPAGEPPPRERTGCQPGLHQRLQCGVAADRPQLCHRASAVGDHDDLSGSGQLEVGSAEPLSSRTPTVAVIQCASVRDVP